jgi:hypothetical protein
MSKLSTYLDRVANTIEKSLPQNKRVRAFLQACDALADRLEKTSSLRLPNFKAGKIIQGNKCRISINLRGWDVELFLEELPGKPLKRQVGMLWVEPDNFGPHGNLRMGSNIIRGTRLTGNESFEEAESRIKAYLSEGGDNPERAVRTEYRSWLEVEPADYAPITLKLGGINVYSEWDKFKIRTEAEEAMSEEQSHGGDPYYSHYVSSSPGAARKLFKMLKAKPSLFHGMDTSKILAFLKANKIGYEYAQSYW